MLKQISTVILCLFSAIISAQENLNFSKQKEIISPQVNTDNSVTFQLKAPNAKEVRLQGDWMTGENWSSGSVIMTKGSDDIWTYTSPVLPSELYSYSFLVDNLKIRDPNNVYLIRDIASVVNIFIVGNGQADLYKINDVPHGTVSKRWYNSPMNNKMRRITVYTPPNYEAEKRKYPVLYLLHGVGGDEEAWIALGRTAQIMDNLIANGQSKPMIVVMTNGNVSQSAAPGESSLGFYKPFMMTPDIFNGQMESSFGDIIKFTDSNYRVKKGKENRAIAGLSMGGFHSLYISANYTNTFDYVGLFSAAIILPKNTQSEIYQNLDQKLTAQMKNGYKLYWIGIGNTDFLYKNVTDFRVKLNTLKFKHEYKESVGGHTWVNWRAYLSEFVPLLFK